MALGCTYHPDHSWPVLQLLNIPAMKIDDKMQFAKITNKLLSSAIYSTHLIVALLLQYVIYVVSSMQKSFYSHAVLQPLQYCEFMHGNYKVSEMPLKIINTSGTCIIAIVLVAS